MIKCLLIKLNEKSQKICFDSSKEEQKPFRTKWPICTWLTLSKETRMNFSSKLFLTKKQKYLRLKISFEMSYSNRWTTSEKFKRRSSMDSLKPLILSRRKRCTRQWVHCNLIIVLCRRFMMIRSRTVCLTSSFRINLTIALINTWAIYSQMRSSSKSLSIKTRVLEMNLLWGRKRNMRQMRWIDW